MEQRLLRPAFALTTAFGLTIGACEVMSQLNQEDSVQGEITRLSHQIFEVGQRNVDPQWNTHQLIRAYTSIAALYESNTQTTGIDQMTFLFEKGSERMQQTFITGEPQIVDRYPVNADITYAEMIVTYTPHTISVPSNLRSSLGESLSCQISYNFQFDPDNPHAHGFQSDYPGQEYIDAHQTVFARCAGNNPQDFFLQNGIFQDWKSIVLTSGDPFFAEGSNMWKFTPGIPLNSTSMSADFDELWYAMLSSVDLAHIAQSNDPLLVQIGNDLSDTITSFQFALSSLTHSPLSQVIP